MKEFLPGVFNDKKEDESNIDALRSENLEIKKKLLEKEETLENLKGIFSIATHDIKNSIFGVMGFSDLLYDEIKNNQTDDSSKEESRSLFYSEIIKKQIKSSLHLIDELSGWVRLEIDDGNKEFTLINLKNQVREVINSLTDKIENKQIKIDENISFNEEVNFDINIIKTVLRNIISNAIKFTENGGEIFIESKDFNDSIKIYIKDTGVGLSKDKIDKLFDKIVVSEIGTDKEKGMGIGLYMCKKFISRNGGNIEVESEGENRGSTFIITIPK